MTLNKLKKIDKVKKIKKKTPTLAYMDQHAKPATWL